MEAKSEPKREPTFEEIRLKLGVIIGQIQNIQCQLELTHRIIDSNLSAKLSDLTKLTEAEPKDSPMPNLRFDMMNMADIIFGSLETVYKSICSLEWKLRGARKS